jgi:hypothetical protein
MLIFDVFVFISVSTSSHYDTTTLVTTNGPLPIIESVDVALILNPGFLVLLVYKNFVKSAIRFFHFN